LLSGATGVADTVLLAVRCVTDGAAGSDVDVSIYILALEFTDLAVGTQNRFVCGGRAHSL
jgi:hypothetical protein